MNENDFLIVAVVSISAATAAVKITAAVLGYRKSQRQADRLAAAKKADKELAK